MKVLIIEDDRQVVRDISLCLKMRYPELIEVSVDEGKRGIEMIETESPDIVMASSSLPDMNTVELVSNIREFSDVPIIVISEAQTEMDRARGLEAGVDEYVTKPLSFIEFLAVTNALFRRTKGIGFKPERVVSINGRLTINFATHEIYNSGKQIHLTPIEYNLLTELVRNSGRVLSHRTLLKNVWGSEYTNDLNYLKKYIYRLRSKLEPEPSKPRMLITERGLGYKFIKLIKSP